MVGPLVCPVCGTPPVPGARFCHACGALLDVSVGGEDPATERRIVTVLFGDLSDFTAWAEDLDPERVGTVTDRVLATLSRISTEMGGRVDKLTGDGVMAVFGAPTAHEDDAERAVRAAARMQTEVRRLMAEESGGGRRMGLRVGLNTGEVLAGVQAHLAYTVVGDAVNTASRLSDAAGVGAVLAGRDTALATMATASWRTLPPLRLKGKREPVPAYELVGLRPPGAARLGLGDEAPFIGRDAEFGRLVGKLLDVVESRRPASIVVAGEAGVGKTRLGIELSRFATELPGARVLWGRSTPYGDGRELAPVAEWVRTAVGIADADDPATAEAKVHRTVARLRRGGGERALSASVVDRLLALLGLADAAPLGPRDTVAPGVVGVPRDPMVEAAAAILDGLAAEGPLVLVVDDTQWASPTLLSALGLLSARLHGPVLHVSLGRSDVVGHEWWDRLPDPELLPLAPLDETASERLLRAYVGGADLDPIARDVLLGRAQGNPFFLSELLHLLVDRGVLRRIGDGWRLDGELPRDLLPAGVQAVLAARIDGLDPTARSLLRDASVIGTRFDAQMLRALEPRLDDVSFLRALEDLVGRGILRPLGEVSEQATSYVFAHALARDVAYAGIPKAERARRHAHVATWAATDLRWPAGEVDALVAAQAEEALALAAEMQLPARDAAWAARPAGVVALTRLGERALARDDAPRAERLLSRALDLAGDEAPVELIDGIRTGRAAARVLLHRLDEAEADLAEPQRSADLRRRSAALVVLGDLRRRRGDTKGAIPVLVTALAAASDAGLDRVAGEALRQLGLIDYLIGRLGAAETRFRDALAVAERVGDSRGAGWALQHLAWSATTRGDYPLAERMLARAADVFSALDDNGGLSWCAGTEAFVRLLQGRLRESRGLAQGLLPIGHALGDRWGAAACLTIDGFAAAELGELHTAVEETGNALAIFRDLGDTWGQAMALVAQGAALRGYGRHDDATVALTRSVRLSEEAQHPVVGALALGVLGYCRLDVGDVDGAQAAAERALAALAGMDLEPAALVGLRVLLAQALRAQGRLGDALTLLHDAEACREGSLVFPRRQALAHLAGALHEAGELRQALQVANDAMQVPAEDVRSRVVALRVLAQCLASCGDDPAARVAVRQAVSLSSATEMRSELAASRRAEAALSAG
ncbi:MAG TPA: adenylate/guanylate cyclase domain-containing protein [Mycobacteriales bacterium]|nr:adenylate/guanylate cyclase domain-containing protein [Mycobacteriales bacterium]